MEAAWCVRLQQPAREFWSSTPKRVGAFFEVFSRAERVRDARAGVIAAVVANTHRGKGQRAVKPGDFFASLKPAEPKIMTPDEMRAKLTNHFGTR